MSSAPFHWSHTDCDTCPFLTYITIVTCLMHWSIERKLYPKINNCFCYNDLVKSFNKERKKDIKTKTKTKKKKVKT